MKDFRSAEIQRYGVQDRSIDGTKADQVNVSATHSSCVSVANEWW